MDLLLAILIGIVVIVIYYLIIALVITMVPIVTGLGLFLIVTFVVYLMFKSRH